MSYQIGIKGHRRAAARFVSKVHRKIQKAYSNRRAEGATQSALAEGLGVHRSVVSRQLNGREDISIGRVAEYAYLLGYEIEFDFVERRRRDGANHGNRSLPNFNAATAATQSAGDIAPSKPSIASPTQEVFSSQGVKVMVEA